MAAKRVELIAANSVTGDGQGGWMPISTIIMAEVAVDITAASGTIALDVWLEVSSDKIKAYEMPADRVLKSSGVAAANASTAGVRDIVDNKTTTTLEKFLAVYQQLPAAYARIAWTLSGTTPVVSFTATLTGK